MAGEEYWDPAYQLMLEEARRSVDRQSERLDVARARAVGLVGFGSVVAAAFGLVGEGSRSISGALALAAFVIVALSSLYVLRPREFHFEMSAHLMSEWLQDPAIEDLRGVYWAATAQHDDNHRKNQAKIVRLQRAITVGVLALAVETLALVAGFML